MNDYLPKPVEPQQLAEVLGKWLPQTAGHEKAGRRPSLPREAEGVFNQKELLARLMGDRSLAAKAIAGFVDDAPRKLRGLKERIESGDAQGAALQAHALKGASATVAAEALRAVSFEVQEAAAAGDLGRALALLPRMQGEFERLKATLKQSGWV